MTTEIRDNIIDEANIFKTKSWLQEACLKKKKTFYQSMEMMLLVNVTVIRSDDFGVMGY